MQTYGIKALVKSYLPGKDAHLRAGIENLLGILKNILSLGEISEDIKSRYWRTYMADELSLLEHGYRSLCFAFIFYL